ncbi:MAG: hypothetical protein RIT04_372 [Candidatus Parcubacteria bacterium]|jgi:murein DD-endopeptidase MepM/ murein hydrolase activator NlpD
MPSKKLQIQIPKQHTYIFALLLVIAVAVCAGSFTYSVHADTVTDIQAKITDRNASISKLEAEIKGYQADIDSLGKQANSLKNTIAELDLSRKKLEANIKVTQAKIDQTNLEIQRLGLDINTKQNNIDTDRTIIAQSLNKLYQSSDQSLIETVLEQKSLSHILASVDSLAFLQDGVRSKIILLKNVKQQLQTNKAATEQKKAELVTLTNQLQSQKKIVLDTTAQQNSLLKQTKDTEAGYQKTLATKKAQQAALQSEINDLESALRIAIDPSSIPHTGSGVLSYPLDNVRITQYFGNTPFATLNPQIYKGQGHTGVDFAASIGTPVRASLSGTVVGVANTDLARGCYSFGKWIMVKHGDGLSTLYAHLSLQSVSVGQAVSTGQIIGYSGNTGYTTGPHLHYGVYATQGVRITTLSASQSRNCVGATIPLADPKAYLNPLSYL